MADQFVARGCLQVTAGEHWIRPDFWSVGGSNPAYPADYTPSRPTPMKDFLSKLTVKIIVDGGTKHEKIHIFPGHAVTRTDVTTHPHRRTQLGAQCPPLRRDRHRRIQLPARRRQPGGRATFTVAPPSS